MKTTEFHPTLELNISLNDREALLEARRQIDEALEQISSAHASQHFAALDDIRHVLGLSSSNPTKQASAVWLVIFEAVVLGRILEKGDIFPSSLKGFLDHSIWSELRKKYRNNEALPLYDVKEQHVQSILKMFHPKASKLNEATWVYLKHWDINPTH